MGVVYKARDTKLDRDVALKFLPPELTRDSEAKERFVHEAKAASSLQHNNICTIHEIDETSDGQLFISMDCYEGQSLKKKIQQGPLSIHDIVDIAIQVAQGLMKAHQKGIVHRDIKPANIIVTNDGVAKIVDFGLVKLAELTKITRAGSTVGTAAYMSPEQIRGDDVDHRTDIFSLGVMLYELTTGQLPFRGMHETALAYEIVNVVPQRINELRPDSPDEFQRIVDRAMEKAVGKRYQSVEDVLTELTILRQALASGKELRRRIFRMPRLKKRSVWLLTMAALFLFGIALYLYYFVHASLDAGEVPSIAILYLKNLGPEADEPYTYGITQDLIVDIAKAGIVRVATMKDVLSIQNANLSMEQIAQRLRVKYVLDGTFKRDGSVFQLAAQIVEAANGQTLWANKLQAQVKDASMLQGQLADAIIKSLHLNPTTELMNEITGRRAASPEAYEYCLRASYLFNKKKTNEDITVAREMYRKAIALDSGFVSPRIGLGLTYEVQGEDKKADTIYTISLHIARASGDKGQEADCLKRLGVLRWRLEDYTRAREYYTQCLQLYKELGDRLGESETLNNIGALYYTQGDTTGLEYYQRALEIIRTLKEPREESRLLNNMGQARAGLGDYSAALDILSRSLTLKQQSEDRRGEGITLGNIADVYKELGDYNRAIDYYHRALKIHRELGDRTYEPWELNSLGDLFLAQEQFDTALSYYEHSLEIFRTNNDKYGEEEVMMHIGKLNIDRGQYQRALDSLENLVAVLKQTGKKGGLKLASIWCLLAEAHLWSGQRFNDKLRQIEEKYSSTLRDSTYLSDPWSLYQAFTLLGDASRASLYLDKAFREVIARSNEITDQDLRQSYLKKVKKNRDIVTAWNQYLANKK